MYGVTVYEIVIEICSDGIKSACKYSGDTLVGSESVNQTLEAYTALWLVPTVCVTKTSRVCSPLAILLKAWTTDGRSRPFLACFVYLNFDFEQSPARCMESCCMNGLGHHVAFKCVAM